MPAWLDVLLGFLGLVSTHHAEYRELVQDVAAVLAAHMPQHARTIADRLPAIGPADEAGDRARAALARASG